MQYTVVIVVDQEHLAELEMTIHTWRKHKPELWRTGWLVLYDCDYLSESTVRGRLSSHGIYPEFQRWPPNRELFNCHSEKMTSALFYACRYVSTPWWLRLDVDAVAYKSADWIPSPRDDSIMVGHGTRSIVSTPLRRMDNWADSIPEFEGHPRLRYFARHRKLHGFCTFYRTQWTREMVNISEKNCGPLGMPLPFEDAYFMFCAQRFRKRYQWMNVRKTGWLHPRRGRPLTQMVEEAMA